ncbi:MAG TPA: APC family permease [Gemmatimonadales bacterium]|nr:APC family permease [Gemmatimonadales bacterium]
MTTPTLVRVMGRWTVTALVINAILGSSIFGLPSVIARSLGSASAWAWLIGAAGNAVIIVCFAEVASRFTQAGGAYLYANAALGRLPGILVGWLAYLTRVSAVAAGANLFTVNLAEFFPGVARETVRIAVLTVLLGLFATINYRGARGGARLSNIFTIGKLVPLAIFVVAGIAWVATHTAAVPAAVASPTGRDWLQALLLIGFAYGGFDGAMFAMGEAKEPRRDAPFALGTAIVFLTVLYTGVQILVNAALPDPGAADRPLAAAARVFLGPSGAALLAGGALLSLVGFLSANFLNGPRLTYALSEHRDAPAALGSIHGRFRTPHVSILLFAVLVWALAAYGSFQWNATLSAVTRLFIYGSTCLALIVLRRTQPGGAWLQVPGGPVLAAVGIGFCALLAARMGRAELLAIALVTVLGLVHWLIVRHRAQDLLSVE